jgi:glutamine synthetase type III
VKDAVSVANNACWAIGELAIKVSAYFYTIWFSPVLNSFAIHKIPFLFVLMLLKFKLFGMGFLLVYVT